jgi:hypothetical protein
MDDLDDLAALLEANGLLTVEGDELILTAEGAALGRALAMGEGEEVLDALLEGRGEPELADDADLDDRSRATP